ncbi:hypothetical protein PtA15_12A371 [Puccinia triticina]|uniref:Uncharacterized protein n=1 Tax=Puccinia triticina TaxID=208348 RepID=A0ABY7D112_9BASI|nr:uncharacterized protein PtA15_12A371 [Puccinia triticina]WAQ90382.1 hypothetical protein PtA15_12A371 [Puccinia triticina]
MGPGSRRESHKLATPSTFTFWVLIWLTSLFLKNVQCMLDPDPAQTWLAAVDDLFHLGNSPWPESAPSPHGVDPRPPPGSDPRHDDPLVFDNSLWPGSHQATDSGYLHDMLPHFAYSPRPASHPILSSTNPRPPPVKRERQNDLDEAETAVRKRMKTSSDPADLPYKIVNAGRPEESEKRVVFEAIRSLERADGEKLINEQEGEYKMLQIGEDHISRFLIQMVQKRSRNAESRHLLIGKSRPPIQPTKNRSSRKATTKRRTLQRFNLETAVSKVRSLYSACVLPDFANSMEERYYLSTSST